MKKARLMVNTVRPGSSTSSESKMGPKEGTTPISRKELSLSSRFSGNMRSVDVQVARLRRKIETDPRYPRYLQTVRGTGYVLIPD